MKHLKIYKDFSFIRFEISFNFPTRIQFQYREMLIWYETAVSYAIQHTIDRFSITKTCLLCIHMKVHSSRDFYLNMPKVFYKVFVNLLLDILCTRNLTSECKSLCRILHKIFCLKNKFFAFT